MACCCIKNIDMLLALLLLLVKFNALLDRKERDRAVYTKRKSHERPNHHIPSLIVNFCIFPKYHRYNSILSSTCKSVIPSMKFLRSDLSRPVSCEISSGFIRLLSKNWRIVRSVASNVLLQETVHRKWKVNSIIVRLVNSQKWKIRKLHKINLKILTQTTQKVGQHFLLTLQLLALSYY